MWAHQVGGSSSTTGQSLARSIALQKTFWGGPLKLRTGLTMSQLIKTLLFFFSGACK